MTADHQGLCTEFIGPQGPFDEWDDFVDQSPQGSIFCRGWWLQAVCPGSFRLLALRRGDRIVAGMPLYLKGNPARPDIRMPPLTQTLGVLMAPATSQSYEKNLSREMSYMKTLVRHIPEHRFFSMHFHPSFVNWLPFHWEGFRQTTRYTYVIDDLGDVDKVREQFSHSKRKNIRKAEKLVQIREGVGADEFHDHHVHTLGQDGVRIAYEPDLYRRLFEATGERDAGRTWSAVDADGNVHAMIFVVFDNASAYFLISSIDRDFRNSGATALLVMNAIKQVSGHTERFDFEGSMIPGVEKSFRRFGARQTTYFNINRDRRPVAVQLFDLARRLMTPGIKGLLGRN